MASRIHLLHVRSDQDLPGITNPSGGPVHNAAVQQSTGYHFYQRLRTPKEGAHLQGCVLSLRKAALCSAPLCPD